MQQQEHKMINANKVLSIIMEHIRFVGSSSHLPYPQQWNKWTHWLSWEQWICWRINEDNNNNDHINNLNLGVWNFMLCDLYSI